MTLIIRGEWMIGSEHMHLSVRHAEMDVIEGKLVGFPGGEALTLHEGGCITGWEGLTFWPTEAEIVRLRTELAIADPAEVAQRVREPLTIAPLAAEEVASATQGSAEAPEAVAPTPAA
jgi:hypothetical protein